MMTRKDFNAMATAFRGLPFASVVERNLCLDALCRILATTNPRFNRIRFVNACTCMPDIDAQ